MILKEVVDFVEELVVDGEIAERRGVLMSEVFSGSTFAHHGQVAVEVLKVHQHSLLLRRVVTQLLSPRLRLGLNEIVDLRVEQILLNELSLASFHVLPPSVSTVRIQSNLPLLFRVGGGASLL